MPTQATFKTVIDSLDLGVLILDQDLRLVYINDWLKKRSYPPFELALHAPINQLFPELNNSLLLECCRDALDDFLPKYVSNAIAPHPLPLYHPSHLGQEQHKLHQAIDVRPIKVNDTVRCQILVHDVTQNVNKENWLKRIANNFRHQAQEKDTSLTQFAHIIENTADAILVLSCDGTVDLANACAKHMLGLSEPSDQKPLNIHTVLKSDSSAQTRILSQHLHTLLDSLKTPNAAPPPPLITKISTGHGLWLPVEIRFSISQDQGTAKLITTIHDRSDQAETERNFRVSENRFQTLAKLAPVGIFRTCQQGIVRYANETWFELTGAVANDINRVKWLQFIEPKARVKIRPKWQGLKDKRLGLREEFKLKATRVQAEPTWVLCNLMAEFDSQEQITGYVGILTDISQQHSNQEAIQRLAYHDTLTGLPNRRYFHDTLEQHIRLNRREQTAFALFALDLNGFKQINDTLGHDAGDQVLKTVAHRLQSLLRESASIARLGGDEFAVMIPGFSEPRALETIAQRIQTMVCKPIQLETQETSVGTSIGIALFPTDAENSTDLVKNADLALYAAKSNKQHPFVFFDKGMNQKAATNRNLLNDLENAIAEEHFDLLLAPTQLATRHKFIGHALLCWQHKTWGRLLQPDFINALQRSRLAKPFTLLQIEKICQAIQRLQTLLDNNRAVQISVALQPFQLLQANFADDVNALFQRHRSASQALHITLTEANLNDYFGSLLPVLLRLQRLGFQLVIADFSGTHLALQKISKLPIHAVQLCPTLIEHAKTHRESQLQLASLLNLAKRLEVKVLCHSPSSAKQLRACGCEGAIVRQPLAAQPVETVIKQLSHLPKNSNQLA